VRKIDFKDLILFLRNPQYGKIYEINSLFSFIVLAWKSFLFIVILDIISGLLIITPLDYFNLFPELKHIDYTLVNRLKIILIFPILEELIFRLPLRVTKTNLLIVLSILIFIFLIKCTTYNVFLCLGISSIIITSLSIIIKKEKKYLNSLNFFITKYFGICFYSQASIFGILHLTNFTLNYRYFYLFPFFIFGFIISGCLFGYLRIRFKYGIFLCITSHILINGVYNLLIH
jgi:hypothetical protein